jgi:PIN domain nuclease of toxin-antitoxin system
MRVLLDTHVAIWAVADTARLTQSVREVIADTRNQIYVSAVCIFEIAVKHAAGRPGAPPFSGSKALELFRRSGYLLLHVTAEHAAGVEGLPPIHGDPFDRLLVAQALTEPLRLVTHDSRLAAYSDTVIVF